MNDKVNFIQECAKIGTLKVVIDVKEKKRDARGSDYETTYILKLKGHKMPWLGDTRRYDTDDEEYGHEQETEDRIFLQDYAKNLHVKGKNGEYELKVGGKISLPDTIDFNKAIRVIRLLGISNPAHYAEKIARDETTDSNVRPELHLYNVEELVKHLKKYGKDFAKAAISAASL